MTKSLKVYGGHLDIFVEQRDENYCRLGSFEEADIELMPRANKKTKHKFVEISVY